jgi:hypothetical protein
MGSRTLYGRRWMATRVLIAALGHRRDADHERAISPPRPAILQHAVVGGRGGVVRFVNDDGLEIRYQTRQPGTAAHGLHTGHDGGGGMLVALRLHDPQGQRGIDEVQFVHGLLDALIAVREDEGPAPPLLDEEGKDHGFARAGWQDEQRALRPAGRGGKQGRDRFVLVRPGCQPQGDGRLGHSLHAVRSPSGGHTACRRRARGHHRSLPPVCLR